MVRVSRYEGVAFLASFLAFAIELILAKRLLPLFGGSASVWNACVVFFQGTLLAATLYGWFGLARLGPRRFLGAQRLLVWAPLLFFPFRIPEHSPSQGAWSVISLLLGTAGPAFFVLSTTTIVLQRCVAERQDLRAPYRIFGASNLGAFMALLAYPFLLEPMLGLRDQMTAWYVLYGLYAGLIWSLLGGAWRQENSGVSGGERSGWAVGFQWIVLSCGPCLAFLATTGILAFNLPSVPLLWALPLAIYLLTLIRAFGPNPRLPGHAFLALILLLGWRLVLMAVPSLHRWTLATGWYAHVRAPSWLLIQCLSLYCLAMACHWSLVMIKPRAPEEMPRYYVAIALGGWIGSLVVVLALPVLARNAASVTLDVVAAWFVCLAALGIRHGAELASLWRRWGWTARAAAVGIAAMVLWPLTTGSIQRGEKTVWARRNFYGINRVVEEGPFRLFLHGNTLHGQQFIDPRLQRFPIGYYHEEAPVARFFQRLGGGFEDVAVLGLGIGSLAAFGRLGQTYDFFELDPDVARIASRHFSYLGGSKARTRVVLGDARLALGRETKLYDLIVLDVFSSDAVPAHILTREAFEVYLSRLKPGGSILCHVPQRLLDLSPLLVGVARSLGLHAARKDNDSPIQYRHKLPSPWLCLSPGAETIDRLVRELGWRRLQVSGAGYWTDDRSSILRLFKI